MALYYLYRISDKGNTAGKLPHATKLHCFKNFIEHFGMQNLLVFADNCLNETLKGMKDLGAEVTVLDNLGNAGSFQYILDYAINNLKEDDQVYLIEDDYLHLPNSRQILLEGLQIADYVTLYDHSDKYVSFKVDGNNHYIEDNGEETKVLLTPSSHWKVTNSTTMTFAAKVKTLKEDYAVWSFFKTQDYLAFQKLAGYPLKLEKDIKVIKNKIRYLPLKGFKKFKESIRVARRHFNYKYHPNKRKLIVCIPGKSTHVQIDHLSPLTNWDQV